MSNLGNECRPSFGVIGLAVMGSNLALNVESRGIACGVFNRTFEVTEKFLAENRGKKFFSARKLEDFVAGLATPRQILIMVKAGAGTDAVIDSLVPLLSKGDVIIDGGNAYYKDTQRRELRCKSAGIHFIGVGISGGEEGALKGPSLMPGGPRDAWNLVQPTLEKIAARVGNDPCVSYIGPDGSGHFVKMVHNGIEYGDMQLIAEAYHVLSAIGGCSPQDLAEIFNRWNHGPLLSFLIEITAKVFQRKDDSGSGYLVDKILDKAGQKGTGKWTSIEALELGVSVPTIAAAVDARVLSSMLSERLRASAELQGDGAKVTKLSAQSKDSFVKLVHDALYSAKIVAYSQGMALLTSASKAYNWSLNLSSIASLWRGGCIIRAAFLEEIRKAYAQDPNLPNLMLDPSVKHKLLEAVPGLRRVCEWALAEGIPVPALSSAIGYFDSYRSARLPQNLTQAQRDFFGAHTYERTDKPGVFHSKWE